MRKSNWASNLLTFSIYALVGSWSGLLPAFLERQGFLLWPCLLDHLAKHERINVTWTSATLGRFRPSQKMKRPGMSNSAQGHVAYVCLKDVCIYEAQSSRLFHDISFLSVVGSKLSGREKLDNVPSELILHSPIKQMKSISTFERITNKKRNKEGNYIMSTRWLCSFLSPQNQDWWSAQPSLTVAYLRLSIVPWRHACRYTQSVPSVPSSPASTGDSLPRLPHWSLAYKTGGRQRSLFGGEPSSIPGAHVGA